MNRRSCRLGLLMMSLVIAGGCGTPSPHTMSRNYTFREHLPVDPPREVTGAYDDAAAGGQLFKMYCGSCHNARPLGERPFSNYHVAMTHMRHQAYLTGKEYRQLMYFLRRWDNVGPPSPPVEPSPKRFVYSQPIAELRGDSAAPVPAPPAAGPSPFRPGGAGAPPAQQPGASGVLPPPQPPPSSLPAPIN